MKKDTQLLLALAAGLKPDHKLVQSAEVSSQLRESFLNSAKFTKEDVFTTAESGVSFFNNEEVWHLMPKIIKRLKEQGEVITADDFTKKIDGGNSLVEYAEKFGRLGTLFAPENWKDNLDEMEKLWFGTTERIRKTFDFWENYHQAAKLSDTVLRESVFARAGLDIDEAVANLVDGKARFIDGELKKQGDMLTVDDLFILDKNGKTLSENKQIWDVICDIAEVLHQNGESLSFDDVTRERAGNKSLLQSAIDNARVASLFNEHLWKGNMGDMLKSWEKVPEEKRVAVDMPILLTTLEDKQFADLVDLENGMSLDDLTAAHSIEYGTDKSFDIRALGLQATWHYIWSLDDSQENGLPPVGLDELRQPHGYYGLSCMHAAVRYGFAEVVAEMLREKGEWFSLDDLTDKRDGQPSILEMLNKQDKIDLIMQPKDWVGSPEKRDEMLKVWQRLGDDDKKKYDVNNLLSQLNRLNLRSATRAGAPAAPRP